MGGVDDRLVQSSRVAGVPLVPVGSPPAGAPGSRLCECAGVLRSGGQLVLVDQFSAWLLPTLLAGRRGKARTQQRCNRLLGDAGFGSVAWHRCYAVIINAVVATA